MADLFASAKSVLRRANHHIADFKSTIDHLRPDQPYSYVFERDQQTGEYVHKLRFREDFSEDVSCILFDAINNLRACLDQMTNAIALRHRGPSANWAYFPFAKEQRFWPDRIKGLANDIPAEVSARFETFEPYKGGNNALWAVNYLANIKKHAGLIRVWYGGTKIRIRAGWTPPPFAVTPPERLNKDEIEIFRSTEPPERHPNMEITYNVVLDDSEEVIQGQTPVALLDSMSREVAMVLREIEAECRRIGLV